MDCWIYFRHWNFICFALRIWISNSFYAFKWYTFQPCAHNHYISWSVKQHLNIPTSWSGVTNIASQLDSISIKIKEREIQTSKIASFSKSMPVRRFGRAGKFLFKHQNFFKARIYSLLAFWSQILQLTYCSSFYFSQCLQYLLLKVPKYLHSLPLWNQMTKLWLKYKIEGCLLII